jgi:hypothetical protein
MLEILFWTVRKGGSKRGFDICSLCVSRSGSNRIDGFAAMCLLVEAKYRPLELIQTACLGTVAPSRPTSRRSFLHYLGIHISSRCKLEENTESVNSVLRPHSPKREVQYTWEFITILVFLNDHSTMYIFYNICCVYQNIKLLVVEANRRFLLCVIWPTH